MTEHLIHGEAAGSIGLFGLLTGANGMLAFRAPAASIGLG